MLHRQMLFSFVIYAMHTHMLMHKYFKIHLSVSWPFLWKGTTFWQHLPISFYLCLSLCPPVCLYLCLSFLFVCFSFFLSVCLPVVPSDSTALECHHWQRGPCQGPVEGQCWPWGFRPQWTDRSPPLLWIQPGLLPLCHPLPLVCLCLVLSGDSQLWGWVWDATGPRCV